MCDYVVHQTLIYQATIMPNKSIGSISFKQTQNIITIAALVLFVFEVLVISTQFDAATLKSPDFNPLTWLLKHSSAIIQWLSVTCGACLIIFLSAEQSLSQSNDSSPQNSALVMFIVNLVCFAGFYSLTFMLFEQSMTNMGLFYLLTLAWCLVALGVLVSIMAAIQPLNQWLSLVKRQKGSLLISMLLATVVTTTSLLSKNLWPIVIAPTFNASEWLLLQFSDHVVSIAEKNYLGIDGFIVHVSSTCSGIEGMGMATSFTLLYLYLIRSKLRFPRALILLPIAAILSWLLNVVRISLLILLGRYVSADFAVAGFHSQAGWFSFIALSLIIIFLFDKVNWIRTTESKPPATLQPLYSDLASAILVCFILYLVGSLITGLDEEPLNWLYPVKTVLSCLALGYFWRTLNIPIPTRLLEATLLGVLTCLLWVWVIPADEAFNSEQTAALDSNTLVAQTIWIVFRFMGAIIVAPLIEELLFRSYLLSKLSSLPLDHRSPLPFHLIGMVLSSVAFAAIHQQWLAAIPAGMIYALARYRGNLGTAIWAHSVTNGLLCIYAISYNQWSYL